MQVAFWIHIGHTGRKVLACLAHRHLECNRSFSSLLLCFDLLLMHWSLQCLSVCSRNG